MWWNYGELADVIKDNALKYGLPKSVVMYIGTTEMEVPQFSNSEHTKTMRWDERVNETAEAWRAAGLNSSNLFVFTVNGGQHDTTAWATAFSDGIIKMFTYDFTAPFEQYDRNMNVVFPMSLACPATAPQSTSEPTGAIVVAAVVVVVSIMCLAGSWWYVKKNYVLKDSNCNPLTDPLYVDFDDLPKRSQS